jgi:methyl-accepting chemotaxis protein
MAEGSAKPKASESTDRPSDGRRLAVRWKIIGLTAFSMLLFAGALMGASFYQVNRVLEGQLRERGRAVALGLANSLALAAFAGDRAGMQSAAAATLRDQSSIAYVVLRGRGDEILGSAVRPVFGKISPDSLTRPELKPGRQVSERTHEVGGIRVIEVSAPILLEARGPSQGVEPSAERRVGVAQVAIRQDELRQEMQRATASSMALGLLLFLAFLGVAWRLSRRITVRLEKLAHAAAGIAAGDLTRSAAVGGADEIGDLGHSFEAMSKSLRDMLRDLVAASSEVEQEAELIISGVEQQSSLATNQTAALVETGSTVSEIAQTSTQATEYADAVIGVSERSEELSRVGQQAVAESIRGMDKLSEQVQAIAESITALSEQTLRVGHIISTATDLAEQSHLLALNAAIEASRAGGGGLGFGVVAAEMRRLAEQSKRAASDVRALLREIHAGTRAAVTATEEGNQRALAASALGRAAGDTIEGLAAAIQESSAAARQIAQNTRQQTVGVDQILLAVTDLSTGMHDTVAGTRRIQGGAEKLNAVAKRLSNIVARYRA